MNRLSVALFALVLMHFGFDQYDAEAQDFRPGYIVTNSRDSISGLVAYTAGDRGLVGCTFKDSKKSKPSHYTAMELSAYGVFNDTEYVSLTLPDKSSNEAKVFVRVLVSGPLTLYRFGSQYYVRNDSIRALPVPSNRHVETKNGRILR